MPLPPSPDTPPPGNAYRESPAKSFFRQFWQFGIKQAQASIFGALLLVAILITRWCWSESLFLNRYDFLFLYAVSIQLLLLALKLESIKEAAVILLFHGLATAMELFKTSESIGSWHYPEEAVFRIANVPLFAGFMYSAVGSYLARVWRIFEFEFTRFPPIALVLSLAVAAYLNFFTHHFILDFRWIILLGVITAYLRTWVWFKPAEKHLRMPLLAGMALVSAFIWLAENICTAGHVWLYPGQRQGWQPVGPDKLVAWFLLIQLSFAFVAALRQLESYLSLRDSGDSE